MRTIVLISLLTIIISKNIINKSFYEELKKVAPFKLYEPEENPFRDWTNEEIRRMLGTKIKNYDIPEETVEISESYDFRTAHPECSLGVRDQGHCGGCWAFAAAMTLQQRYCKDLGERVELSPQDLISCDTKNFHCNGGSLQSAWYYLRNYGIVKETCFPFSSRYGTVEKCTSYCKNGEPYFKYSASYIENFYTQAQIMEKIYNNGPVEAQYDVYSDFMYYKEGIYVHTSGYKEGGHAVVIIGYGNEKGINYWICQNSWGENWGEKGYFRIKMGECGIDSDCYAGSPRPLTSI